MQLDINIDTKHDSYYIILYYIILFHEDFDYNQIYNFVFNHDDKFWTFLTIKDIQNQNQQHPFKGFNTCALKNINTFGPSYEVY
jgi:hypothetical protein